MSRGGSEAARAAGRRCQLVQGCLVPVSKRCQGADCVCVCVCARARAHTRNATSATHKPHTMNACLTRLTHTIQTSIPSHKFTERDEVTFWPCSTPRPRCQRARATQSSLGAHAHTHASFDLGVRALPRPTNPYPKPTRGLPTPTNPYQRATEPTSPYQRPQRPTSPYHWSTSPYQRPIKAY